jgi:hypothetical protein
MLFKETIGVYSKKRIRPINTGFKELVVGLYWERGSICLSFPYVITHTFRL